MQSAQESTGAEPERAAIALVKGIKLPPQPKVVMSINREIQKDEPCFQRIAELVSQDPALSAKVLKVVNSPVFGVKSEITSIHFAVSRMGLNYFFGVILSTCLRDSLGIDDKTERLWRHTTLVARLCEKIAVKVKGVAPDKAYLAGLFHDSAIPIMMKKTGAAARLLEMTVSQGGDIQTFEEQHIGTHHAVLAYLLARSWGLPDAVAEAIQFHHGRDLSLFPCAESKRLCIVLRLADHLARECAEENEGDDFTDPAWHAVEGEVLFELGLDDEDMLDLRELAVELNSLI